MEDLLILIAVISIIFGILQIILFCKIWGMTNDIRDLRSEFIGGTDQWTLRKAILKGDKNRIAELLFNDMLESRSIITILFQILMVVKRKLLKSKSHL